MQAVFPPVIIRKPLVLPPTQCVLSAAWRHTTVTVSCVICPASAWQNSYLSNCFSPFVFFLFCFKMWWGWGGGGGIYCGSMIWGGGVFKAEKEEENFPKVCSKKWKLRLKPIKIHTKVGKKSISEYQRLQDGADKLECLSQGDSFSAAKTYH